MVINVCKNITSIGFHVSPVLVMIALLCWCEHLATPQGVRQAFDRLAHVQTCLPCNGDLCEPIHI